MKGNYINMEVNKKFLEIISKAKTGNIAIKAIGSETYISNMFFDEVDLLEGDKVSFWYDAVNLAECVPHVAINLNEIVDIQDFFKEEIMDADDYGVDLFLKNGLGINIVMLDYLKKSV